MGGARLTRKPPAARAMSAPAGGRAVRVLERIAIVVISFAIAIGVIALLSGGLLAGRDDPGLAARGASLGIKDRDQGRAHLAPGTLHPVYDSDPPTSGPHVPVPVLHDEAVLSDDQVLQALEEGNIVILYGTRAPPPGLAAVAARVAAPFTPALAAAGQAVILARRPGTKGLIGLAWTRTIRVARAQDPRLRGFAELWLGRGAARP
jgi:uncharacterized protein DUF3105